LIDILLQLKTNDKQFMSSLLKVQTKHYVEI
jgi:hypothetical protein